METPTTDLQKLLAEATKGPWVAIGTDPAEGVDCFWIKTQPNAFLRGFTKEIGSVNGSQNDPAQQANARLIAMAPDLAARVLELEAENKRLREGLAFYANPDAWNHPPVKTRNGLISVEYENEASQLQKDRGKIARTALKGGEI